MLNEKANFTNFTEDKVHQEMSKSHLDLQAAVRIGILPQFVPWNLSCFFSRKSPEIFDEYIDAPKIKWSRHKLNLEIVYFLQLPLIFCYLMH